MDQERQELPKSLGDILGYFDEVETANVEEIEPSAHAFP
jgi:Asp-tRNA(Asn)/Glu-tRNA(Gln) amidotransferase C subunit